MKIHEFRDKYADSMMFGTVTDVSGGAVYKEGALVSTLGFTFSFKDGRSLEVKMTGMALLDVDVEVDERKYGVKYGSR